MKLNVNSFFDGSFDHLNLNDFYLLNKDKIPDSKVPSQIDVLLKQLGRNTYGGYGENRKDIWKNTYLDKSGGYIHLGVDINIPCGTEIKCPFDAEVVDVFVDQDQSIGWGGRLILTTDDRFPLLVLGHIEPSSLTSKIFVNKGDVLGVVGTWPHNGNTFEHLHVQSTYSLDFATLDGYGFYTDLSANPNPFTTEF
jgi:murein DD-endopeptidase MepM/ murein hydrolase activator NlpD